MSRRALLAGLGGLALIGPAAAAAPGLELRQLEHQGDRWRVVIAQLGHPQGPLRLRLVGQAPGAPRPLTLDRADAALRAAGLRPLVLTNAGMFHEGGAPVGLHVEDGVEYAPLRRGGGAGNFFLLPNGVLSVGPKGPRIDDAEGFSAPSSTLSVATQSGPLLVHRGAVHPKLIPGSSNRALRSAAGVRADGALVFAISDGPVRFFDTATLLRDGLGCPDALYLDGTISGLRGEAWPNERGHPRGYGGVLALTPADGA
ncbi:MAG: hypothetical protein RL071_772 [Pseudomonadota bacterium]